MAQYIDKRVDIRGRLLFSMPFLYNRIFFPPRDTLPHPVRMTVLLLISRTKQRIHKYRSIGTDRQVNAQDWLFQFQRIDIHHGHIRLTRPRIDIPSNLIDTQTCANRKHEIAVLYGEVPCAISHISAAPTKVRIIRCYEIDAVPAGDDREIQRLIQTMKCIHSSGKANTVSRIEHRPFCLV